MNRIQKITTCVLSVALIASLALNANAQRPEPKKTEVHGHTMYTVLAPGAIPAIFEPDYISVEAANETYYANEPLMVVTRNGETKAWSTWHLDQHEIVNDTVGGTILAATW